MRTLDVLWFMGPKESSWNGVSLYSRSILGELCKKGGLEVNVEEVPYAPRTLRRYIYQLFVFPIIMFSKRKSYKVIVVYQEDLAFLTLFSRLLGKKIVVIYHHVPVSGGASSLLERIKNLYIKCVSLFLKVSDAVVCPSATTKDELVSEFGLNESSVHICYNAFNSIDGPDLEEERFEFFSGLGVDVEEYDRVLLNVGTDETRKNLSTLYRSLSHEEFKRTLLVRVGKSIVEENRVELEDLVSLYGLKVLDVGFISTSALKCLYRYSDFYVAPSVHEGFGRTLIEAQKNGLIVIASKIPVFDEILGEAYVAVGEYMSPLHWGRAISSASSSDKGLKDLGFKNVARFDSDVVSEVFYQTMIEVLEK